MVIDIRNKNARNKNKKYNNKPEWSPSLKQILLINPHI